MEAFHKRIPDILIPRLNVKQWIGNDFLFKPKPNSQFLQIESVYDGSNK